MLRVFYGDNRTGIEARARGVLGEDYEVYEGETLTVTDLPSIFSGVTLFSTEKRRILLKNLTEKAEIWAEVPKYTETEHEVVIWEPKVDKRSVVYKELAAKGVEITEVKAAATFNRQVFGILDTAIVDGPRAVKMVEGIMAEEDPYMFVGLMASQAVKKMKEEGVSAQSRKVVKMLAELDLQMKTSTIEPWMLIKSFLLRVGN